ncbi:DUF5104 domain-containing protein [Clostridium sp. KNHs216]|uniref:DUF5104 domain-containing protein n=1 Tax=Clostridium sp. KNHs216 TaxID=1550235 RepID=UPI00163A0DC8|nr:DUF5104 domain-containing protein [Clostridium sp. KNHs216]
MKLHKVICFLLSCSIIILSGCSLLPGIQSRAEMLTSEVADEDKANLKTTQDVLNCFSKKDIKALKALLCPKTQRLTDTDHQILAAFKFFDGEVTFFNKDVTGNQEDDTEYGKKVLLTRGWNIEDVLTTVGKKYSIYIHTYNICDADKSREGITDITVTSGVKNLKIGYSWPLYDSDGNDLSYKLVDAFSDHSMNGIKSMLCPKSSKMADIETQIEDGLNFFKGNATEGVVKGNSLLYDGDHDYHTTVSDDETVKNGKPTRTSITVINENIETDANKTYKIEFHANILYTGDETRKGITQIIIIDGEGKRIVIGERLD